MQKSIGEYIFDARFGLHAIIVNMLRLHRKGPPRASA